MGDLSDHFSRHEFACRCGCGGDTVDAELLAVLERLRVHYGVPVRINSGYRCRSHNMAEGGVRNSQHLLGKAADIVVRDVAPRHVRKTLTTWFSGKYGIRMYETFVHLDVRKKMWR